jgi:hypothetical protein
VRVIQKRQKALRFSALAKKPKTANVLLLQKLYVSRKR